jgi:hypothetical protein
MVDSKKLKKLNAYLDLNAVQLIYTINYSNGLFIETQHSLTYWIGEPNIFTRGISSTRLWLIAFFHARTDWKW